jgi:hypothetical protein
VLRIVDELDPLAAQLFERSCVSRLTNVLPKTLVGDLPFDEVTSLVSSDLLVEPGLSGQIRHAQLVDGAPEHRILYLGVSVSTLFDGASHSLFDVLFGARADRFPDATEDAAVLTAVKDATRR